MGFRRVCGKILGKYVERNLLRDIEDVVRKDDILRNCLWRRDREKEKMLFGNNGRLRLN